MNIFCTNCSDATVGAMINNPACLYCLTYKRVAEIIRIKEKYELLAKRGCMQEIEEKYSRVDYENK